MKNYLNLLIKIVIFLIIIILTVTIGFILYTTEPNNQIKHNKLFKPLIPYESYNLKGYYNYELIKWY